MFHRMGQCFLIAVAFVMSAPCPSLEGKLTIQLVSTYGRKLSGGNLSIHSETGTLVFSTAIQSQTIVKVPYGGYVVTFKSEFLKSVSRRVQVDRPDVFVVLATNMAEIVLDGRNEPVSVSIRAVPPSSCIPGGFLWAKLIGVYSDYATERPLGSAGYALFEPLEVGTYIIIVIDGREIRALQPVETRGPITVVNLALSACK